MGTFPTIHTVSDRLARTVALGDSVSRVRFVKGARLEGLERLRIRTIRDLLLHTPRRYLDFTTCVKLSHADVGEDVTVVGVVDKISLKQPKPRMQIVELFVVDETGVMQVSFFKQPWLMNQIKKGDVLALSGKVTFGYGFKQMKSPFFEIVGSVDDGECHAKILPIHPATEGVSPAWMRRIESCAVADFASVSDFLPSELVARHGLMTFARALRAIHFPATMHEAHLARRRLAYDELLILQLALRLRESYGTKQRAGCRHAAPGAKFAALLEALPFELTQEQRRAVDETIVDMQSPLVMNRLLLGDVGTGKTAVAAACLALCADSETQGAVMAPTGVLAAQYAAKVGPWLDAAGISWRLVTGSTPAPERRDSASAIAAGDVDVVFGTTALLSEDIDFNNLTFVVVDEQHRFGVDQRSALARKGYAPDVLSMTATPIPRTLALSIYGDVAISRITERPNPGAGMKTKVLAPENVDIAYGAVTKALDKGQQAYIVCTLVDESDPEGEADDAPEELAVETKRKGAVQLAERLSRFEFKDRRVGLLHGRMAPAEKDRVMREFSEGRIDVLVSTTVIEVGVDVPNATVMVVWDADRFGLATLHQLRGRVGRGDIAGDVFLVSAAKKGSNARKRLQALEKTTDGLELAELDLKLRHEGDVLGYKQSGAPTLKLVDLVEDADLVEAAHADAVTLLTVDPALSGAEHAPLAREVVERYSFYFDEGAGA